MPMVSVWVNIDEKSVVSSLEEAANKLDGAAGEIILDFVSVARIDTAALRAIEGFATKVAGKPVKVVLRDVNVGVYKVLKLAKLARQFSFVTCNGHHGRTESGSRHAKPPTE